MSAWWDEVVAAVDASPRDADAAGAWVGADESVSRAARVLRALPAVGLRLSRDAVAQPLDLLVTRDELLVHELAALRAVGRRVRSLPGDQLSLAPALWLFQSAMLKSTVHRVVPVPRTLAGAVVWLVSFNDAPDWVVGHDAAVQLPVPVWLDPDAAGDTPAVALVAPDRWPARLRDRWGAP